MILQNGNYLEYMWYIELLHIKQYSTYVVMIKNYTIDTISNIQE